MKRGVAVYKVLCSLLIVLCFLFWYLPVGFGAGNQCVYNCIWVVGEGCVDGSPGTNSCSGCSVASSMCDSFESPGDCSGYSGTPDSCECVLPNPEISSSACTTECIADRTPGDSSMYFFSSGYSSGDAGKTAKCCGNQDSEYYISNPYTSSSGSSSTARACCDDSTDCAVGYSCYSNNDGNANYYCNSGTVYTCSSSVSTYQKKLVSGACCYWTGTDYEWEYGCTCHDHKDICENDDDCKSPWQPGEYITNNYCEPGELPSGNSCSESPSNHCCFGSGKSDAVGEHFGTTGDDSNCWTVGDGCSSGDCAC